MWVLALFTNGGAPYTGLSPTLFGYDVIDNSTDVNAQAMSEIAKGWYKYNFSGADDTKPYCFTADGGVALPNGKRYAYGSWGLDLVASRHDTTDGKANTIITDLTILKKIETGRWKLVDNQMIFYDDDGVTPLYTFNHFDADGVPTNVYPAERVPV